ncbi:MAG: response regulator [Desulfobacterales bacterium]|jgi:CheY-like chemotaxis protein|nr:response regulator [Desulfobacterales bacterium]
MIKLLLVTPDQESFRDFTVALIKNDDVEMSWAATGQEGLTILSETPVDLVIVDDSVGDMTGIEFMKKLLSINPMINCAAVSPLSHEAFHEASEGLGVLAQLPVAPGKPDAENLLKHLKDLKNLLNAKI